MCVWLELIPRQERATGTGWGQGHGSWSGRGRVTPPSSRFNYRRFPRFSSSQASACSLLAALLELLRVLPPSGNATAAQSPSLRDEQHLTLSLTLVPGWQQGRSCSVTASSPCPQCWQLVGMSSHFHPTGSSHPACSPPQLAPQTFGEQRSDRHSAWDLPYPPPSRLSGHQNFIIAVPRH